MSEVCPGEQTFAQLRTGFTVFLRVPTRRGDCIFSCFISACIFVCRPAFPDPFLFAFVLSLERFCVIIIRNIYIAPNPTRLGQSSSQFKTRMNITIKTWDMHTPDNPTLTAKRRQIYTHPRTINAIKIFSATIHGPWTHLKIANQMLGHHDNYMHENSGSTERFGRTNGFSTVT